MFAGSTLFESGTRTSVSHIWRERSNFLSGHDEISDPLDRKRTESRVVASVDHGIHRHVTLSFLLPYVEKELESNLGRTRTAGIGDAAALAKWRFYKRDWRGGSVNFAIVGGVELPTGETNERQGGARIAPGLQAGSGSWDPFVALAMTTSNGRYRFDALALAKQNTRGAQDYEAGDLFVLQASAKYRFYHAKYPGPSASATLGLQYRHESASEQYGGRVTNSGLDALIARGTLGWHPIPRMDLSFSVDVPVHEDVNGQQLGLDVRTFLALGIRF